MGLRRKLLPLVLVLMGAVVALAASAAAPAAPSSGSVLLTGLDGGSGSTVGPDGAIRYRQLGDLDWSKPQVREQILALMK